MKQGVYSVYDRKAMTYGALMFFANHDMARRSCSDLMRAGGDDVLMVRYPEDFDVYVVGEFETDTGYLVGMTTPVRVCGFSDFAGSR
ncbi:VP5 [Kummerowia striata gokushovirus]|nr:VP5 [Kummerowia striata gokushovirus]